MVGKNKLPDVFAQHPEVMGGARVKILLGGEARWKYLCEFSRYGCLSNEDSL
jgi:hypothetical protein